MIFALSLLLFAPLPTGERPSMGDALQPEIVALSGGGGGGGGKVDRVREPKTSGGSADRVREPRSSDGGGGVRDVRTSDGHGGGSGGGSGGDRTTDTRTPDRTSGASAEINGGKSSLGGSGSGSGGGDGGGSGSSGSTSGSGSSGGSASSGGSGSSGSGTSGSGSSGSGSSGSGSNSGSSSSGSGSSGSGSSGSSGSGSDHSSESVQTVGEMRTLAARETPEFDAQGFPVRRGEVVGLDLSRKEIARAELLGFKVTSEQRLAALGMHVTRLRAPPEMTVGEAVKLLRDGKGDANSVYDFDHYYGVNGYEDNIARTKATPPPRGNLWIGMIDTGVSRHTALQGVRVDAHDFAVSTRGQPLPSKHGTAVASILAGQGAGRITSANIFTADGKPYAAADTIAAALNWLVQQQVPVINISLAGPRNALLDLVVARAIAKGHVIVAAAGNGGPGAAPAYPGAIAGVVAATAVDSTNHIYRYANQGNYVFIAAPGVGVPAAAPGGSLAAFSGTSFAAPFVAANMARCRRTAGTAACIDQLRKSAVDLGAPGKDPVFGWGLIRN
jgi:hypothetical protein